MVVARAREPPCSHDQIVPRVWGLIVATAYVL